MMPQSSYDTIAHEYYDEGHVTSRNFDDTTVAAISDLNIAFRRGVILELGAGRGRAREFLNVGPERVVQLDNSEEMFGLPNREECMLKVLADACNVPLASGQFAAVVAFLADPFFGLNSMSEAYRMLVRGGKLLLTVPSYDWASALREELGIDVMTTRFQLLGTEKHVVLPSLVHQSSRIQEILETCGFSDVQISSHTVPNTVENVSPDIQNPAQSLGVTFTELSVIQVVRATK